MYKIVSDSACDLSKEYLEKHDVTIVPLSVSFDGEIYYRDGVDITRDQCYQKMVDNPKLFPKTSLPSVESYAEVFRKYVEQGLPVVCFTITTLFSGSYNSAMNAKSLVEEDYPDANICVIDSKQNSVTQALLIDQFVRMLEDGLSFEQVMSKLEPLMASARIFFTVGSLDYLQMGGRIGKVATAATGRLGVKPVIVMKDGDIGLGGIGRNRNKLKASVLQVAKKYLDENNKDNFIVSVGYGYDKEEGFEFMKEVESTLDVKLDSETNVAIGIVSAVHTGPYPIGLGVIRKYETF